VGLSARLLSEKSAKTPFELLQLHRVCARLVWVEAKRLRNVDAFSRTIAKANAGAVIDAAGGILKGFNVARSFSRHGSTLPGYRSKRAYLIAAGGGWTQEARRSEVVPLPGDPGD
jgi:hypothetical protein